MTIKVTTISRDFTGTVLTTDNGLYTESYVTEWVQA